MQTIVCVAKMCECACVCVWGGGGVGVWGGGMCVCVGETYLCWVHSNYFSSDISLAVIGLALPQFCM